MTFFGCSSDNRTAVLRPFRLFDPAVDTSLSQPTQFAVNGCDLYVYDRGSEKIVRLNSNSQPFRYGSSGSGPGELRHLFALSARSDGVVFGVDWVRGRLLSWSQTGESQGDIPLTHHVPRHSFVGPIVALLDGTILDAPWGGRALGLRVDAQTMDSAHLIYQIDSQGVVRNSWGSVRPAFPEQAGLARALYSSGDIVLLGDTIVYLKFAEPVLEFFALRSGGREPVRHVELPRLRVGLPAVSQGIVKRGETTETFRTRAIDVSATSLAAFGNDLLAITLRHADTPKENRGPAEGAWAKEQLIVLKRDGTRVATYELDGRETRSSAFLRDGSFVRLYFADSTGGGDRVLGIYQIPTIRASRRDSSSCL